MDFHQNLLKIFIVKLKTEKSVVDTTQNLLVESTF